MRMLLGLLWSVVLVPPVLAQEMPAEYAAVLTTLARQGDYKDGVLRVNIPRNDLNVSVEGVATPTPFGFGGWIALTKGDRGEVTMGEITIGRPDLPLKEMGATINARMGLNTWAAFYGADADAVVAGEVAMRAEEVTPVLKALRSNGIDVVAIHHHMTSTEPTVYFLHYWGRGPAATLAAAFRAAVDQTGKTASARR